jgi:hypothetical protein
MLNKKNLKSRTYAIVSSSVLFVTGLLLSVPSVLSSTKTISFQNNNVDKIGVAAPVKVLDVGTFKEMDAGRVKSDNLTPDHIPSGAAVIRAVTIRDQKLDPNAPETDKKIPVSGTSNPTYLSANTIVYDTDLHKDYSRTYLNRNNPAQIKADAADLKVAFSKDVAIIRPYLIKKYDVAKVDAAFKKLDDLNKASGLYK